MLFRSGRRDAAMAYLMAKTGLRAIQIQRADCGDLECLEIQVHQRVDEAREAHSEAVTRLQWILRTQAKGQQTKESFVNLMPEVYERLQRYLEARGPVSPREPLFARHHDKLTAHLVQARAKEGGAEGATLAPNETLRLTTRAIQLRITEAMIRCGLREAARPGEAAPSGSRRNRQRRVTPHSLRHTAATEAARTESPFKVQAMLDHKDIRTTQKYFHAIDRLEEGAGPWGQACGVAGMRRARLRLRTRPSRRCRRRAPSTCTRRRAPRCTRMRAGSRWSARWCCWW